MTFGDGQPTPGAAVEPAADYDRFVDWDKRLAREAPFFRRRFEEHGVRRVIDVGCGTGKHAIMWAGWGLDVVGVDPSESMLAQARANAAAAADEILAAGGSLRLAEGGFGELAALGLGPADAVTCTGNALPHVDGVEGLRSALRDFAQVLRPGGVTVLHLLNHDRLVDGSVRTVPPVVREADDGTWVFLRVIDHVPGGLRFDFVTLHRPADAWESGAPWDVASRRSVHTAIPSAVLLGELDAAGLRPVGVFGDHAESAFEPREAESIVVVAARA